MKLDIDKLVSASSCLPGEIVLLASGGSLGGIRKVAEQIGEIRRSFGASSRGIYNSTGSSAGDTSSEQALAKLQQQRQLISDDQLWIQHAKSIVAIEIFNQLTPDEQLLTTSLLGNICHFDEALVWSMSRKQFHNDILRWNIAWMGLLESGWVVRVPDLGYSVSSIAAYVKTSCDVLDIQRLHEWYLSHWSDELVRVNIYAYNLLDPRQAASTLEYFTQNISHFKHVIKVCIRIYCLHVFLLFIYVYFILILILINIRLLSFIILTL